MDRQQQKKTKPIKWTPRKDNLLIAELFMEKPYEQRSGSTERGVVWENISRNLNEHLSDENFKVNHRSVRDRFKVLREKAVRKRNVEENPSGIAAEHTELDDSLDELDTLFKEADEERDLLLDDKKKKTELDRNKAIEMRKQSMETFSQSKKRLSEDMDNDEKSPSSSKKAKGKTNVFDYPKEKKEGERAFRDRELTLRERELEMRDNEADNLSTQQQQGQQQMKNMMQMLLQQQKQQQQQQQQQSQMWMSFFNTFNPNTHSSN